MGRTWQSLRGASLTFSLSLPMAPADWSGLSLAAGVALAEAMDPPRTGTVPRLMLKWPNDLWLADPTHPLGGRKLGGVLIETVPVGERRMCVVGVGLNVLPLALDDLDTGYACLQELSCTASAPWALNLVAAALVRAMQHFERDGFASVAPAFAARDLLAGRRLTTSLSDLPEGEAAGVDSRGALQVVAGGRTHTVVSGEVSVRPVATGDAAC
jgi:BirA family biotin operon repressor/biotin-[acetyl-CoA-carboxylase] ligase